MARSLLIIGVGVLLGLIIWWLVGSSLAQPPASPSQFQMPASRTR
jgi:hypothetical protein